MAAITVTCGCCFDLPEDVLTEILARSSVKSLLRFKCVCKSWYALIETPRFISKHLNNTSSNNDNAARIAISHCNQYWTEEPICSPVRKAFISFLTNEAIQLSHDIPAPFFHEKSCSNHMIFYGPCNGIICVKTNQNLVWSPSDLIALWNPATREIKRLSPPNLHYGDDAKLNSLTIGFGIDTRSNEYKVVMIIGFRLRKSGTIIWDPVVEVYNSSTDSWRKLDVVLEAYIRGIPNSSTYLNGFYYWIACDDNGMSLVLSFDFGEEVFEEIPLPDIEAHSTLVKFNETIAVMAYDSEDAEVYPSIDVWVLNMNGDGEKKKKKMTWSKLFRIPFPSVQTVVGFLRSGEALVIVKKDHGSVKLELYDPSTQLLKNLRVYDDPARDNFQMVHYVESLVSFKRA